MDNPSSESIIPIPISQRVDSVRERIISACQKVGRDPESVCLVAVSKRQDLATIRAAYAAGIRHFGENYLDEALQKMNALADLSDIRWEMVGHVQSRKAKMVAQSFCRVHSLDSLKLAYLLNESRGSAQAPLEVLVEVNISGETTKSGIQADNPDSWEGIIEFIQKVQEFPYLRLSGLMCMPPLAGDPEESRPYFRKTRQLLEYINEHLADKRLTELSMGTSADFPVAIEEGATIIRIGEALLGPRPPRSEE